MIYRIVRRSLNTPCCDGWGSLTCHCGGDICVCGMDGECCPGCDECKQTDDETDEDVYDYELQDQIVIDGGSVKNEPF